MLNKRRIVVYAGGSPPAALTRLLDKLYAIASHRYSIYTHGALARWTRKTPC
jgi:hypothetical protein